MMAGRDLSSELFGDAKAGGNDLSAELFGNPVATPAKPLPSERAKAALPIGNASIADSVGGFIKGASRIGNTLLMPVDYIYDKITGNGNPTLSSLITGEKPQSTHDWRTQQIDQFMAGNANPNSNAYKANDLIAQLAGTSGAGGAIANGVRAVSRAPKAIALANAIRSGGFATGAPAATTLPGMMGNAAIRISGGAINGGVAAGMINPESATTGGMIGGAIPVVGKVVGKTGSMIGGAVAPFTQSGRDQIISNFLKTRLGDKTDEVITNLQKNTGSTPGFTPTTGQAAGNADLATLGRVFSERNPGAFQDVLTGQRQALADSIRSMGGDEAARAGLLSARDDATSALYSSAKEATVPSDFAIQELMKRPAMRQAVQEAQVNAANRGENIVAGETLNIPGSQTANDALPGDPVYSGKALHEIKMALDAAKNQSPVGGANKASLDGIRAASGDYSAWLESAIPEYGQARDTYSALSKPINQMDLGNAIADKYIPAIYRDVPAPNQLNHDALARVLQDNGDSLARHVTGFKGATLENTLSAEQMSRLQAAVKDTQLIKDGMLQGKPTNSSSYQNLAFNSDAEKASVVPGLLSHFMPYSATAGLLKGVRDMAYTPANNKLTGLLGDALISPEKAVELLKKSGIAPTQKMIGLLQDNPALLVAPSVISAH